MFFLLACAPIPSRTLVFTSGTTPSDDSAITLTEVWTTVVDTGSWHDLSCDRVPVDWWCFVEPYWYDKPQGECPAVAVDTLMAAPPRSYLYHWRCDDPTFGVLDGVVDGAYDDGAEWVFAADGSLLTYLEYGYYYQYCNGSRTYAVAGKAYGCPTQCLVESLGLFTPAMVACE